MTSTSVKVIFDTNVWISFLIGKRLSKIKKQISEGSITIITTEQLLIEIKVVTGREKLKKILSKRKCRRPYRTSGNHCRERCYKTNPFH